MILNPFWINSDCPFTVHTLINFYTMNSLYSGQIELFFFARAVCRRQLNLNPRRSELYLWVTPNSRVIRPPTRRIWWIHQKVLLTKRCGRRKYPVFFFFFNQQLFFNILFYNKKIIFIKFQYIRIWLCKHVTYWFPVGHKPSLSSHWRFSSTYANAVKVLTSIMDCSSVVLLWVLFLA